MCNWVGLGEGGLRIGCKGGGGGGWVVYGSVWMNGRRLMCFGGKSWGGSKSGGLSLNSSTRSCVSGMKLAMRFSRHFCCVGS